MKKFNRFLAIALGSFMLFSVGCETAEKTDDTDDANNSSTPLSASDVEIWSCLSTLKILRDKQVYDDYKLEPEIDIVVANGEYENAQIIITPDKDVAEYTVKAFDLQHENGVDVFPKERIDVYKQKYMVVNNVFETATGASPGYYPDAILPFEAAVAYEENNINAGDNQGITFRFDMTPDNPDGEFIEYVYVKPGVYTGKITLDFKDFTKDVPVRLEVLNLTVSEENHAMSIFGSNGCYQNGELNYSQDMQDAYTQALIDYRLAPSNLMRERKGDQVSVDFFAEKAYEFLRNPRCSNLCFFVKNETVTYTDPETGEECTVTSFDRSLFMNDMRAIIKKSVEKDLNMVDKMTVQYVDEPVMHNRLKETKAQWLILQECLETIVSEIENTPETYGLEGDEEKQAEYIASVRSFVDRFVVTEKYNETYAPYIKCWCPQIKEYDTEEQRAQYDEQVQKWFYHGRAPYPCYYIEADAISLRAQGWMMADYDVTGLLYWATNLMGRFMKDNVYMPIDDYYDTNVFRYTNSNGNGYLFYPGGQYGLDVPVSTLRLEAVRDGLEEYELLYALEQTYKGIKERTGIDFDTNAAIRELGSALYNGTKVYKGDQNFADTRTTLLQLANCAASSAQMCIMETAQDDYGTNTYKIYLKGDVELKQDGEVVTDREPAGDGYVYTVRAARSGDSNALNLSFVADGQTYTYTQNIGGKVAIKDSATFANSFVKQSVQPTLTLVDGGTVYPEAAEKQLLKISLPAVNKQNQTIRFEGAFIDSLTADNRQLIVHLYNPNETALTFTVLGKRIGDTTYTSVTVITLQPGENSVTLDLSGVAITDEAKLECLIWQFSDGTSSQTARDIYLKDIIVYYG